MIVIALAMLATPAVAEPTGQQAEIVVAARRLKEWRGKAKADARGIRCKTTATTGDAQLDQIACDSMGYCMAQLSSEMETVGRLKAQDPTRSDRIASINRKLELCGEEQQQARVSDWVERRAAARIKNAANR